MRDRKKTQTAKIRSPIRPDSFKGEHAQVIVVPKGKDIHDFVNEMPQKLKKSIYEPLKEEFLVFVEYINILERKLQSETKQEISLVIEFLDTIKRKCDFYLNYQLMKAEK